MTGSIFNSLSSLFSISDEQAMWRVRMEDDPQAFAQLVQRWEKPIQSLCARMTGDLHRGEDLAQETFARVFARRKDYLPSGKFSTFLWRVALNLCYDELRRITRRRESPLEENFSEPQAEEMAAEAATPDLRMVEEERAEIVRAALLRLEETYRAVVVLRHYEGLKFREISEVLEIPEGTVKSRMAEALSQLNKILSHTLDGEETHKKAKQSERLMI
ncbi:MAG: polymerase sigma factor, sigma-70 family [Pedosphaera sp.]|nr:polymerase sigma factor, sigma-70 family [Pedosphaera sp.]